MKIIRILGLAAVTAIVATAFVGAGSASAASLCKVEIALGGECPEANRYPSEITLKPSASKISLVNSQLGEYSCSPSEMTISTPTRNPTGALVGKVTSMSVGECNIGWCGSPQATNLPYRSEITSSGKLILSSGGSGKPGLQFHSCHFGSYEGLTCTYTAAEIPYSFTGGMPAHIKATGVSLAGENNSPGCVPSTSWTMSADYELGGAAYATFSSTATSSTLKAAGMETASFESSIEDAAGSIKGLTFAGGKGGCTEATALGVPYSSATATGTGFYINGWTVEFKHCTVFNVPCVYSAGVLMQVSSSQVSATEALVKKTGGNAVCPGEARWSATYPTKVAIGQIWIGTS
jgi:hypothetical protein